MQNKIGLSCGLIFKEVVVSQQMGAVSSYMRDVGLRSLAFQPPPCAYTLGQCETISTVRGERVALKLYTPQSKLLDDTKQRWIARRQYEDTKLLCIFSHGNADDLSTSALYSQWLADSLDMNVVCYDYKGYGNSESGVTTEHSMNEALETVFDLAVTRMGVPVHKVVLFGKSIGTGPTVFVASRGHEVAGVVLVSPLASGVRVLSGWSHVPQLLLHSADAVFMPSIERITHVHVPVCIIHGLNDAVIDVANARALSAACSCRAAYPGLYLPGGHNDLETKHGAEIIAHVGEFLRYGQKVWTARI